MRNSVNRCLVLFLCFFLLACTVIENDSYVYSGSYTALGDSISYGKGSVVSKSWTDLLVEWMHIKNYEKLAVCSAFASSRFPGTTEKKYDLMTQILKVSPDTDMITLMIGINDCLLNKKIGIIEDELFLPDSELDIDNSFSQALIYDLRTLKERAPLSLIIIISPPEISFPVKTDLANYVLAEKQIAQAFDIPFLEIPSDVYSSMNPDLCCSDLIHPTDKGYLEIASYLFPKIKSFIENK